MIAIVIVLSILAIIFAGMAFFIQRKRDTDGEVLRKELDEERRHVSELQIENASLKTSISALNQQITALQQLNEQEKNEKERLRADNSALSTQIASLRERIVITQEERQEQELAATDRFKNLANEIFKAHATSFKETSEERLHEILAPLKVDLNEFRKAVNSAYSEEAKERFSLRNEIKNLMELNRTIGKEAQDLTRALKGDSKIQGDWGEMILERLLEMSGLKKDCHFRTQVTTNVDGSRLAGDNGQVLRPDVVVYYPDDRCVVIDSKVSLNAYIDFVNASPESNEANDAGKRHLISVRRHIDELAQKHYQDLVGEKRLDFVMMFIPNEGAYLATMKLEPSVWQEAYNKRVLLTSPTHLISVLKMLEQLWKQDAINRNVQEIARLSGTMVDKVVNFMGDLDDVRKAMTAADIAYERARKRLCEGNGNVLVTAKKIVALGAKSTKADRLRQYADEESSPKHEIDKE